MHNNMKKLYPGHVLKNHLWTISKETHPNIFQDLMKAMKTIYEGAFNWLVNVVHLSHWCRAYFREGTILDVRSRLILGMFESIRLYLLSMQNSKREWIRKKNGNVCPKIKKYLEGLKEKFGVFIPKGAGNVRYQVEEIMGNMQWIWLIGLVHVRNGS